MSAIDQIVPTNPVARQLKHDAVQAKQDLLNGTITYEQAKVIVGKYVDFVNKKAAEMAKKYGQKARKISVNGFLR